VANKLIVESGATFNGECKMGVSNKTIQIGDEKSTGNSNSKIEKAKAI
jgi:hypothetical protein